MSYRAGNRGANWPGMHFFYPIKPLWNGEKFRPVNGQCRLQRHKNKCNRNARRTHHLWSNRFCDLVLKSNAWRITRGSTGASLHVFLSFVLTILSRISALRIQAHQYVHKSRLCVCTCVCPPTMTASEGGGPIIVRDRSAELVARAKNIYRFLLGDHSTSIDSYGFTATLPFPSLLSRGLWTGPEWYSMHYWSPLRIVRLKR